MQDNQTNKTMPAGRQVLTDKAVKRLVGHKNVVYYDCGANAWNTNKYNGYTISSQDNDTMWAKLFKEAMEQDPEFSKEYEFVAPVTQTIYSMSNVVVGTIKNNPEYSKKGTAVVGNIIVRNKNTNKLELYGKSWFFV